MSSLTHYFLVLAVTVAIVAGTARAETAGQYIDDATITTKVKTGLVADPSLKKSNISVETDHCVVWLTGLVASKDQEAVAVDDANKVTGVREVKNKLTVRTSEP